jgi:hypothetical protein
VCRFVPAHASEIGASFGQRAIAPIHIQSWRDDTDCPGARTRAGRELEDGQIPGLPLPPAAARRPGRRPPGGGALAGDGSWGIALSPILWKHIQRGASSRPLRRGERQLDSRSPLLSQHCEAVREGLLLLVGRCSQVNGTSLVTGA